MNIISTADSAHGQPLSTPALNFLQGAYRTPLSQIAKSLINGNASTGKYILYGCELSSTGGNTTVQRGVIFFSTELFEVRSTVTFPDPAGSDVVLCNIVTTYDDTSPTIFSDGFTAQVRAIRKIEFSAGVSGSGFADYDDLLKVHQEETYGAGTLLTRTVLFTHPQYIICVGATGLDTINLDNTNAVLGTEVIIKVVCTIGDVLAFTGGVERFIATGTASLTATGSTFFIIKIRYINTVGAGRYVIEVYNP